MCVCWLGWIGKVHNASEFFFAKTFGKRPLVRLKKRLRDDAKVAYRAVSFDYASRWNCFRIVFRDNIRLLILVMFMAYLLLCDQKVFSRRNPHWQRLMKHPGSWRKSVTTMLRRGIKNFVICIR
jgi:hypothetical protein